MFTNYVRIAVRNLIKHKGYTAINVLGLATGMSICMLIILFIFDQDRKDEHNPDANRIYRLVTEYYNGDKMRSDPYGTTPYEFKELVEFNVDGIEETSQIVKDNGNIKFGDKILAYSGLYGSPNFFDFFHFNLTKGVRSHALDEVNQVVLSESLAAKLFGGIEPVGQLVQINEGQNFVVSGVVKAEEWKTHMTFDLVLPMSSFLVTNKGTTAKSTWEEGIKHFYNYLKLKDGTQPEALSKYLAGVEPKLPTEKKALYSFSMQRLDEINLGRVIVNEIGFTTPFFVPIFLGVMALVIILSASFNYMNLAIARAMKRAKEVGVRKVIGAGKRQIAIQFLIESMLVMMISLVVGAILLELLVPAFNGMKVLRDIDGAITLDFFGNAEIYLVFISFAIIVGIVAGLYPAIYLASFKSIVALKGIGNTGKSSSFLVRKILVFMQYCFSIVFIITTIILYQQADIFTNTDYGFDNSKVMNVSMSNLPYETFRNELLRSSDIAGVSAVSNLPVLSRFDEVHLQNAGQEELVKASTFSIDEHTVDNLGLNLISGRNFIPRLQNGEENAAILNEKAVRALGFDDPAKIVNTRIKVNTGDGTSARTNEFMVVGVVADFTYEFIFKESGPLLLYNNPSELRIVNIKYNGENEHQVAQTVEEVWKSFDNVHPFEYELYAYEISDLDDEFADLVGIVGLVSGIAIIIACLGQFSMVVHQIELKIKEIGIRKVLGSNIAALMMLLSKDFLIIMILSIICAVPVAWKINVLWTSRMAVHPEVSVFNISFGIILTFALALATIFALVFRAASANPVDALKYEG